MKKINGIIFITALPILSLLAFLFFNESNQIDNKNTEVKNISKEDEILTFLCDYNKEGYNPYVYYINKTQRFVQIVTSNQIGEMLYTDDENSFLIIKLNVNDFSMTWLTNHTSNINEYSSSFETITLNRKTLTLTKPLYRWVKDGAKSRREDTNEKTILDCDIKNVQEALDVINKISIDRQNQYKEELEGRLF